MPKESKTEMSEVYLVQKHLVPNKTMIKNWLNIVLVKKA